MAGNEGIDARRDDGFVRRMVRLNDVLPRCRFVGGRDIPARGCHDRAGDCGPGDVYVVRTTADGEGGEGLAEAVARGAVGIVSERMVPAYGAPVCLVANADEAMARICHALAGAPADAMHLIAVAGSAGKTTTAWLTAGILAEAGVRVGVISDLGCLEPDAAGPSPVRLTDPSAVAGCLARLHEAGCTHVVVEVSAAMLARRVLAGIRCATAVVTNVVPPRPRRRGAAPPLEARLLDILVPDGDLVVCHDDAGARRLVARWLARGGAAPIRVGLRGDGGRLALWASPVERQLGGQTFLLQSADEVAPVAVATPVQAFVCDALLAAAVGRRLGIALSDVVRGLESIGSVAGRVERIDRGQDGHVFIDQPSSRHALVATLASLRRLTAGRLVVLAERGLARRLAPRRFRALVARWSDETVVVPDGILADDPSPSVIAAYARVDRLLAGIRRRDCVVVLGRGFDPGRGPGGGDDGEPHLGLASLVAGWFALAADPTARRAA